ncbi:MAG: hypothetical protein J3Q66DRAFT_446005 [Benniella sp.]|nr:MAG: hypothetical protein J3Q66DRAFT_446005 [Benniella sp.]
MGAISPQPSPAESKNSKMSLSTGVALAILLLNALLSVVAAQGKLYTGTLPVDQRFDFKDTLQSPDGSKIFRFYPNFFKFGVFSRDGSYIFWEHRLFVFPHDGDYLKLTNDSNGFAYYTQGSVLLSGFGSGYNSKELVLNDNGLLYIRDKNDTVTWMNECSLVMSPNLVSKQSLPFADFCLLSPDGNSYMKLESGGKLVVYTGYTPQHTFERQDQQGESLEFDDTGSLSIASTRCSGEYCYREKKRNYASLRFEIFIRALGVVDLEGAYGHLIYGYFTSITNIAATSRARQDGGCEPYRKALWSLQKEMLYGFDKALSPSSDRNKLTVLVKSLVSDVHQRICSDIVLPLTDYYTIFGTTVKDTYTATVTNDAKISIKNSKGEEMWTNYPNFTN